MKTLIEVAINAIMSQFQYSVWIAATYEKESKCLSQQWRYLIGRMHNKVTFYV